MKNKEQPWHHHSEKGRSSVEIADSAAAEVSLRETVGLYEQRIKFTIEGWGNVGALLSYVQMNKLASFLDAFFEERPELIDSKTDYFYKFMNFAETVLKRKFTAEEWEGIEQTFVFMRMHHPESEADQEKSKRYAIKFAEQVDKLVKIGEAEFKSKFNRELTAQERHTLFREAMKNAISILNLNDL